MDTLEIYETQAADEVLLVGGVKARKKYFQGNGNWLEHAFNDSDCLYGSAAPDCHMNASQTLATNVTSSPSAALINGSITTLPPHLRFDERSINDIAAYSVLFVIAAIGNLTVFITLFRNRHRKSRVNLMIMHLAAADLMVTLINFPIEVGWRITVQWLAGNLACKLLNFLRAFGLYLSSLVLVCISLDRYFAIVHPLKVNDAQRRGKMMLSFAWSIAAVCSIPQSVIFYEASHPQYTHFKQCVTFYFFETPVEERTYNVFCLVVMYFLPLLIIIVVYFRILWEISQKSKDNKGESSNCGGREGRVRLRRSDMTNIERARARTLKMTVIIVLAFIICWTPYVVMVLWYMFDKQGAEQVQTSFQDALFIMAVSNSCVNPIVYGTYTINLRKELNRCFGRKAKPPVLARKSTGSTAMRTTVTAQLSSSNTLKMSTHTQVLPTNGSSRTNSRRNNPNTSTRDSPQQCQRPLQTSSPPTVSSTSFQVSPFSSSTKLSPETRVSPTHSHHQPASMASGCVMLEIEVDVDETLNNAPVTTPDDGRPKPMAEESFSIKPSPSGDTLSATRLPYFPSAGVGNRNYVHDSGPPENVQLKSFTSMKGTPIFQPKFSDHEPQGVEESGAVAVAFHRKLSADSGVFLDSKQRRKQTNQLIRDLSGQNDDRHSTSRHSSIEMKCINPMNNLV
ncbi:adipokinetic hormone/corazonin-related peptide receptor variant I-like isoform X2 [Palaemon carinicauda]|uniref:adipokinetic hormone/corazonin-related peptide receptor variant I-like isoform X2 n=1 Tax=Palaemon carinicauda TaxID=392227 RepID=UPI0035B5CDE2